MLVEGDCGDKDPLILAKKQVAKGLFNLIFSPAIARPIYDAVARDKDAFLGEEASLER
jgi:hypothetical protein